MLQLTALYLLLLRYRVADQSCLAVGVPRYSTVVSVVRFVSLYTLAPSLHYLAGRQAAIRGTARYALATGPLVYGFSVQVGLNDILPDLIFLPVGFACGFALNPLSW